MGLRVGLGLGLGLEVGLEAGLGLEVAVALGLAWSPPRPASWRSVRRAFTSRSALSRSRAAAGGAPPAGLVGALAGALRSSARSERAEACAHALASYRATWEPRG